MLEATKIQLFPQNRATMQICICKEYTVICTYLASKHQYLHLRICVEIVHHVDKDCFPTNVI